MDFLLSSSANTIEPSEDDLKTYLAENAQRFEVQGKTAFEPLFLGQTVSGGVVALVWLHIPGPRVKAIIALSIMFVASEALACDHANPRLSERALNRRLWLWPDPRVGFRRMIGRPRLDPVKNRGGLWHRHCGRILVRGTGGRFCIGVPSPITSDEKAPSAQQGNCVRPTARNQYCDRDIAAVSGASGCDAPPR